MRLQGMQMRPCERIQTNHTEGETIMLSRKARALNFIIKHFSKPFQARAPLTPGVMRGLRKVVETGSRLIIKQPAHVSIENVTAHGVPGEWVVAGEATPDRVILYLHGGGYFFGSPRTHRTLSWRLAQETGSRVLSLEYRLVPEHVVADCCDDAVMAYQWLLENGSSADKIIIGGDSAGGGLTLLTLLEIKNRALPLPLAAFCLSPFADMSGTSPTYISNARKSHMFHPKALRKITAFLSADHDPYDPAISPAFGDYAGLPPLFIQASDTELLLNDARLVAQNAAAAGVEVELKIWHNLPHVFTIFADIIPEGKQGIKEIAAFINSQFASQ